MHLALIGIAPVFAYGEVRRVFVSTKEVAEMEETVLEGQLRKLTGRAGTKDVREAGFIPAVVYKEGKESFNIQVPNRDLVRLLHAHKLENAVINLKIKDDKKAKRACLVKEIQYDPVRGNVVHVDFSEISLTKAIKVNIPVVAKGEAAGVKADGGSLEFILWEIEVECLPTDMPQEIEVDVSALKIGDGIHVKDVKVPAGVKILNDPDATVVHVAAPMKIEEAPVEAAEGEEKQEPEVIKEKKPVTEEEAQAKEETKKEK